jgi:uncharacterized membrane protein
MLCFVTCQVNVLIDTVDGVRGTYAAQDIANGSIIAVIPDSATYKLTSGCSANSKNPYFAVRPGAHLAAVGMPMVSMQLQLFAKHPREMLLPQDCQLCSSLFACTHTHFICQRKRAD